MSDAREQALERIELLARLWRSEREAAHAQFVAEREALKLDERVRRGTAAKDLEIAETGAAAGGRSLLWLTINPPERLRLLRVGPGSPVKLWRDDPEEADSVRGVVVRRRRGQLGVMIQGDIPDELSDRGLRLDRDDDQATFDRGDRSLHLFREAKGGRARLRDVLLGGREPVQGRAVPWRPLDTELNTPQREAVTLALAAEDLALVHGPPGTGKTRTLVEIVRQTAARGGRVLASAASNTAVDNLAERLVTAGLKVVRLGHPARVSAAMESCTLDALLEGSEGYELAQAWMAEANQLRLQTEKRWAKRRISWQEKKEGFSAANRLFRDARQQLERLQAAIVAGAQVVCSTAAGADSFFLGDQQFELVVLDEATQATDPIALVAALRSERIVMAGDPQQLPPTVIGQEAERGGLGETMFERLAERWGSGVVRMLEVQHRMHATLMAFPSRSKYGGRLQAAPEVAGHLLSDLGVAEDPFRPDPLVFVDTAGKGWQDERDDDDPSTCNPEQAERTAAEVRRLISRGLGADQVGVITPYDAQVRRLRDLLAVELAEGLEIGSVDGFQGREKEAIVLDLVRSNHEGQLGFLRDTRRLNVAVTRAKRFLLVIGDSATLGSHKTYADFMAGAEEAGGYVSAWSDEAEPFNAP